MIELEVFIHFDFWSLKPVCTGKKRCNDSLREVLNQLSGWEWCLEVLRCSLHEINQEPEHSKPTEYLGKGLNEEFIIEDIVCP